jgi:hypothetical protein
MRVSDLVLTGMPAKTEIMVATTQRELKLTQPLVAPAVRTLAPLALKRPAQLPWMVVVWGGGGGGAGGKQ